RGSGDSGFVKWHKAKSGLEGQAAVMISHSLPDLSRTTSQEHLLPQESNTKKQPVPRQTTMPTVPQRHASFQRQISHCLQIEETNPPFSVCNKDKRNGLGMLKPELYRAELTRQSSVESGDSDMETMGQLTFTLKYDRIMEGLVVKVVQAKELPIKDVGGSSDPYVKVFLLPDRKKRYVTKVHRRNLNPTFNETFIFSVLPNELPDRTLQFSVYDFDRFSRNDLIGQVFLRGLDDTVETTNEMEYTMDILNTTVENKELGSLMLSLCYLPTAGRLTVTVIKLHNLKPMDITGSS
ncbi:unnamed protein product, partial [Meganyctiphanes norvegica]